MNKTNQSQSTSTKREEFDFYLKKETVLLKTWFEDGLLEEGGFEAGSEIEFVLLNNRNEPEAQNIAFVNQVDNPSLIVESGATQLEINSTHYSLTSDCLTLLHHNIAQIWNECVLAAESNHQKLVLIGSIPTVNDIYKNINYLTPSDRYHLIQQCLSSLRGQDFSIQLNGYEQLVLEKAIPLCISGLMSAFQLHLKVPLTESIKIYNTVQIISAPMLALCANSPYLNGKDFGHELRINLLEQFFHFHDYPLGTKPVDLFGNRYLSHSFWELYNSNQEHYPRLLEEVCPQAPIEEMFHLRQLNSVVHRWNRPVLGFQNQLPHLRIEHRIPSTGPTLLDMIANAAFFYGIVTYFSIQPTPVEHLIPFSAAKKNFYTAARYGLNAQLLWFNKKQIPALDLLKELLPLARQGLSYLKMDKNDIDYYLNIIQNRLNLGQNGAIWQRAFIKKYGNDFSSMLCAYVENQYKEIPVAQWK